jgi:hypothetical protein
MDYGREIYDATHYLGYCRDLGKYEDRCEWDFVNEENEENEEKEAKE